MCCCVNLVDLHFAMLNVTQHVGQWNLNQDYLGFIEYLCSGENANKQYRHVICLHITPKLYILYPCNFKLHSVVVVWLSCNCTANVIISSFQA